MYATWRNMVIVFAVVFIFTIGVYVYLFKQVQTTATRASTNLPPADSIRLDEERLEAALKLLADKEARSRELISTPSTVVDPAR